jgi:hypothetical protein
MSNNDILNLTVTMESYIDDGMKEVEIMRSLLKMAEEANANLGYQNFRIGDGTYNLEQLEAIQREEEHDVLFKSRNPKER